MKEKVSNFAGNAEGRDIVTAGFDVIVTDGFTGNVVLKTVEGTAKALFGALKNVMTSSLKTKIGALAVKSDLKSLKESISADTYGGAPLLGVKGVCLVGHGSSNATAIKNGVLASATMVRKRCFRMHCRGGGQAMTHTEEQQRKVEEAQRIIGRDFDDPDILLSAITHPSATEGKPVKFSYERLEFLGDSILGAIVANEAFHEYPDLDEGGLTRIKVALVSGTSLAEVAEKLGFADVIVFGSSERGTGRRGLHSALENVYEAVVAALFLDSGIAGAQAFVRRTLIPENVRRDGARARKSEKRLAGEAAGKRESPLRTSLSKRRGLRTIER